jgi:hypothetical protein
VSEYVLFVIKACLLLIVLKVIGAYKVADRVPVLPVLFEVGTDDTPHDKIRGFMEDMMSTGFVARIKCTSDELILMKKLLYLNSTKVAPAYSPERKPCEETFKVSFLLPIGFLGLADVGKLVKDGGCEVCGQKTNSRCSQCHMASYCGQGENLK